MLGLALSITWRQALMSEYQRYEFMTSDRPLTRAQLEAVNALSSHIDASSTHALIEYQWGNFKHDPLKVLHEFFDGFLYWANWGAPELALRFPHGILPVDLLDGYDLAEVVTFTQHPDYDLLDIHFGDLEAPDEWVEYELGSLIALREELMDGDLRALYIVWLASQRVMGSADEDKDDEDEISVPPVPPALGTLTSAQQALSELLQVPHEVLVAAARYSSAAPPSMPEDVATWVTLLPPDRRTEYLVRLARHEPGLSRLLVKELRELSQLSQNSQDKSSATLSRGEHVPYATLIEESTAIRAGWEREKREQERLTRQRQLQQIHDHPDQYWHQVDLAVTRGSGAGYDEAAYVLSELREVAERFQETRQFHERFRAWVRPHLRRPALVKRLQDRRFPLPDA
jgi:hypothetical protein